MFISRRAPFLFDLMILSGSSSPITFMSYNFVHFLIHIYYLYLSMILDNLFGCHLCECHIQSYFLHVTYKFFILIPSAGELCVIFLPSKIHLKALNTFSCVSLLDLVFLFSRSLVSNYPTSIFFHLGLFVHNHLGILQPLPFVPCLHTKLIFLFRNFWRWHLLGQFGLGFRWCYHLGHFPCLMGTHLHMSLLRWFFPLVHF